MTMAKAFKQAGEEYRRIFGDEIRGAKLKRRAIELTGCGKDSVLPSDFCYNRTNKGIKRPPDNHPVFLWIRRGVYRYVGPNYQHHGEVIHEPKRKR